jgi:glyoxylase-like metal-dependent hydrolase (beta-lactamase superfamily II)
MGVPQVMKTADWFAHHQIESGVWVLQDPIGRVVPQYDVGTVNLYLIEGRDRAALIDAGMGIGDLANACRTLTERPLWALASHSHWDHVGGLYSFADRRIHNLEADRLEAGYDVEGVGFIAAAPASGTLAEGDVLDLGGRTLTVWHTPGHSPGSVSFFDSLTGYLFSADTVYAGTMWMQTSDANLEDWRRSLERLAGSSARALCGGHEEPIQQTELAVRVLDALEQALAGQSQSLPFAFDPGSRKHMFGDFNILLPG